MAWPKVVPILEAEDMCRGGMQLGECRCLVGWIIDTFGGTRGEIGDYDPSRESKKILAMIEKKYRKPPMNLNDFALNMSIPARAFNWACRKPGYTVPCER